MTVDRRSVRPLGAVAIGVVALAAAGCGGWQGANSLPLPGTAGGDDGAYTVTIEMPNVTSIQRNSRVRVGDVTVGNVTDISLDGWHALVEVSLDHEVDLPQNTVAKVGQTSLLGSLHIELAAPITEPAIGRLKDGDVIPLDRAGLSPTTEQTLAAVSTVLNGGGLAQIHDIDRELNAALGGNEAEVRTFLTELDNFTASLNDQKDDIILAMEGLDRLSLKVNQQSDVLTSALERIPPAIEVLNKQRDQLSGALTSVGNFADVANRVTTASSDDVKQILGDLEPTLRGLADSGTGLTRTLGAATYPFPLEGIQKFVRGDAGNLTATIDLTMGRIDTNFLQGTPFEGALTDLETSMGRTVGRSPDPRFTKNPMTAPLDTVVIRGTR